MTAGGPFAGADPVTLRNLAVYVGAQAILGAQMPMIFTVGGLAGTMLAPTLCLATLPITAIVFGSMLSAPLLADLMRRRGRRSGFVAGAFLGALGAGVSAAGLWAGSFGLLLLGSLFSGGYMASQGFLRFAAVDTATEEFRPKAIGYVLGGGLVAAIIGPTLGTAVADTYVIPFLGTYLAAIAINLGGVWIFAGLKTGAPVPDGDVRPAEAGLDGPGPASPPPAPQPEPDAPSPPVRSRRALLAVPEIRVAMIVAMVAYGLMNLVMTSTPLAVVGCGFSTEDAGRVVSAHVVAMFLPSFFTGSLIARFGIRPIMALGLGILACAGLTGLSGITLGHFFAGLILLGLGWNFAFVAATTLLASAYRPAEKERVQGLNDTVVFGCVTLASLASGGLLNCTGGDIVQGWSAVNLAMVPFLTLAGGALIWLWLRPASPVGAG